jgi:hypothetical protein
MGHFKLSKVTNFEEFKEGLILPESDLAIYSKDAYYQFKYEEEDKSFLYDANPGIYSIFKDLTGFHLKETSFVNDSILEEFLNTKHIEEVVDCFFNNLHLYAEFGIEVPKRGVLLYGPAGSGRQRHLIKPYKSMPRMAKPSCSYGTLQNMMLLKFKISSSVLNIQTLRR